MSYSVVLNDILRVRIVCMASDQVGINVLNYRVIATSGSSVSDSDIAAAIDTTASALYIPVIGHQAQYIGTGVQKIWPLPLTVEQSTRVNTAPGTGGSTLMDTGTCGMLKWYTTLAGAAQRGRIFIPFPGAGFADAYGNPDSAYISGLDAIRAALAGTLTVTVAGNSATLQFIIYHRNTHGFNVVTTTKTSGLFHTLRSRSPQGRKNSVPF